MKITIRNLVTTLLVTFCVTIYSTQAADEGNTPETVISSEAEEQAYLEWASTLWESIDKKTGEVKLTDAEVTLSIPDNFYFLDAQDADKVLVQIWGNPPGQPVLGMPLPDEYTPFDEQAWAVTVEFSEEGYVSDQDATEIDYTELLTQMQSDARAESKEREKQGYGTVQLVGWAAEPFYNSETNKMHWAKELSFAEEEPNTLNYNVRALGRKGVQVLNFIASIDQKDLIQSNLAPVMAMAEFDEGARYGDFKPGVDKVAAYGLGALVAGKVLAKTGLVAAAFLFLKKFGNFIILAFGALFKGLVRKRQE